jgi:hypothetical protein
MAYEQTFAETAAIGLIDQHTLVRSLSPELMLVDPALAERARELLREPHEANGKGEYMSALGTHEITAGTSLGLEPPLSPPVVRGPVASALPAGDGLSGLPTPPPAIRPPESTAPAAAPVPVPVPAPQADVPQQPEPAPAAAAPPPAPAPAPAPAPTRQLEPELPAAAPAEEAAPVIDYFAAEAHAPAPEVAPVEEAPATEATPVPEVELHTIPLMAPAPAEEPVELPAVAPAEPEPQPEPQPAAAVVSEPFELVPLAPVAPEPEPIDVVLPVVEQPVAVEPEPVQPVAVETEPVAAPELEELFTPARSDFRVVVRLRDAESVEVGWFRDFGTAMEGAQEVIEQFSTAAEGRWPFYAGRFIRPDLIVSVDVVEGSAA